MWKYSRITIKLETTNNAKCDEALRELIDHFKEKLQDFINDDYDAIEIDFHPDVTEHINSAVAEMSRAECVELIDDTGNEDNIDCGIDHSSLTSMIESIAMGCMSMELFSTDIMQYLQEKLNNETIDKDTAKEILEGLKEFE
jgi:hypothetical protein